MAGVGPASKDPDQRARRNKDPKPTDKVAVDGALRGPELPDDALPSGEPWHARTLAWWKTWRSSAQAQTFIDTDWDFLLDTALMHHTMWAKGRWEFASELRLRAAKFGATPEDRLRLRIQVETPGSQQAVPDPEPKQTSRTRYGGLRAVPKAVDDE